MQRAHQSAVPASRLQWSLECQMQEQGLQVMRCLPHSLQLSYQTLEGCLSQMAAWCLHWRSKAWQIGNNTTCAPETQEGIAACAHGTSGMKVVSSSTLPAPVAWSKQPRRPLRPCHAVMSCHACHAMSWSWSHTALCEKSLRGGCCIQRAGGNAGDPAPAILCQRRAALERCVASAAIPEGYCQTCHGRILQLGMSFKSAATSGLSQLSSS